MTKKARRAKVVRAVMRMFKVRYVYRQLAAFGAVHERKAELLIEAPTLQLATPKALRTARRCCRALGDEHFLRLHSIKDQGVVS